MRVMARPSTEGRDTPWVRGAIRREFRVVRPDGHLHGRRGSGADAVPGDGGARAALKEVRRGAIDISGRPLELAGTERMEDLVIVMTYDTGSSRGRSSTSRTKLLSVAAVLVVPEDPDNGTSGSPFVWMARATAGGGGRAGAAASAIPGTSTAGRGRPQTAGPASRCRCFPPAATSSSAFADPTSIGQPDAR